MKTTSNGNYQNVRSPQFFKMEDHLIFSSSKLKMTTIVTVGRVVGNFFESNATLWPILQVKTFQIFR